MKITINKNIMETLIGLAILIGIVYLYAYLRNKRIAKQKQIEEEKARQKEVKKMFDKVDRQLKERIEQHNATRNLNKPISFNDEDYEKRKREALRGETTTRTNDYTPIVISSSGVDYDFDYARSSSSDFDGFGSGGSFGGGGASGSWSDDSSSSSSSDSGSSDCGGGSDD